MHGTRSALGKRLLESWQLYVFLIPAALFIAIFRYGPMYGLQLAFKSFNVRLGITRSPWIGLAHFIRLFFSIALPLSGPIIGVLTMPYALTHWNSFFFAFVFLTSKSLYPLQIILRNILIISEIATDSFGDLQYLARIAGLMNLLKFSVIVVASVPVLALYSFVQRYCVKGIMIGSIKG